MGAEETSMSRSRQILRDPKCFKEVRGYFLPPASTRCCIFITYTAREDLSIPSMI